jgi:hypothetical protein
MTDQSPSPSPSPSPSANTDDRLVSLLKQNAVPMTTLHERYGPLLELVRTLIGVELESSTVAEVTAVIGPDWSTGKSGRTLDPALRTAPPPAPDSLRTKLSVLRHAPKAIALDRRWQQGVPHAWPAVGAFLRNLTGHDFPVLSRMRNNRAVRAVASMLRENLNPDTTVIGLEIKPRRHRLRHNRRG